MDNGERVPVEQWVLPRALRGESGINAEYTLRRKDTGETWVGSYSFAPIRNKEGEIVGAVVTGRDITEQKRGEKSLREAEAHRVASRYARSLIETSLDPLVTISPEGKITDVNAATEAVTGWARDALIGTYFAAYFDNPTLARFGYREAFRTGSVSDYALEIRHRDGHLTTVVFNAAVYRDETGKVAGVFAAARDITALNHAHEVIRELYNRLNHIASRVPGVIYQYKLRPDGSSCFPYASEAIRDIYRVTPEDVQEDASAALANIHPEDYDGVVASIQQSATTLEPWQYEYRVRFADGTVRWLLGNSMPNEEQDGAVIWDGFITDITEHKQIETALQQSEQNYRDQSRRLADVIWGTDIGTWEWNVQTGEVIFNERWAEIIGHTLAELWPVGIDTWTRFAHPDDLARSNQRLERCFSREADTYECEARMRHKNGDWIWVSDRGRVIEWTADGKPLRMAGTHQDITERKHIEDALRESEARLDFALQNSAIGAWEMDLRDHTTQRTLLHDRIYGYAAMLPRWTYEMFLEHVLPEDRPEVDRIFHEAVAARADWHFEFRIRRADGEARWVYTAGGHLQNAQGKPKRVSGIVQDITERKSMEEAFAASARELVQLTCEQQAMLDNELVGIMKLRDMNIIWKNKAMERIFGYGPDEMEGQSSRILFPNDASWQAQDETGYALLDAHGTYRTQLEMVRKDAGELWMDVSGTILSETEGESLWVLADITPLKIYQDKIGQIAFHDNLTGFPNRLLITDRLHQALALAERSNQMLAVCYLDLDGFKPVNDSYGHEAGDKLLIEIAHRLQTCIRANDTTGRLGGDEFVLLLTNVENPEELNGVLLRIMEAINQAVAIDEAHEASVSASIGIALFPQDGTDPDTLLRHADQAMYAAKQSGKNRYSLFDVTQDAALKIEQENLANIRLALDRHEFVLLYQPKVNLKTRAIIGVEALIRWQHPQRGMLPPAEFLPTVKNHAYGIELGEWVIDMAFTQMAEWHDQHFDMPVSVNIAAYHLQGEGFVPRLRERFAAHPAVQPNHLELEVLESSALVDVSNASKIMQNCCEIGVRFALDDFGTGYSSLTYLKRLPVDILKIDQSFVHGMLIDPEDLSIIEGVIGLAKSFHRQVIAEGVETTGHGERLMALGCDLAQGYVIAQPMPGHEIPGWVAAWQQHSARM